MSTRSEWSEGWAVATGSGAHGTIKQVSPSDSQDMLLSNLPDGAKRRQSSVPTRRANG